TALPLVTEHETWMAWVDGADSERGTFTVPLTPVFSLVATSPTVSVGGGGGGGGGGSPSSLVIVPTPRLSEIMPFTGDERSTEKFSVASTAVSPTTFTMTNFRVSPGVKFTVEFAGV